MRAAGWLYQRGVCDSEPEAGGRNETNGWISHEYLQRLSVFDEGGCGDGRRRETRCLSFHFQSLLNIHRYYFCFLSLRLSSTFVSSCVRNPITHPPVPKECRRVLHTPPLWLLFFLFPVFKRPCASPSRSPSLHPRPSPLFTRRSPALANKPLIFRSPLGTFCHHVASHN